MKLTVNAPAKINLFLDIVGRLDNGYHSLFMIMQAVGLADTVTVEAAESGIELSCSEPKLPCGEKNIAYKAAKAFFEATGIKGGVRLHIDKRIPFEAGLAGGSADAAATLVGLNELYGLPLSERELCEIGLRVGSDVPFCIVGGTCLSQNTGGVLSYLKPLKQCSIVISKPVKGVSTAEAYSAADSVYLYHPDSMRMLDACERGDFGGICRYAGNVFEQVVEVVERVEIKRIMREEGAALAQMSGSGPSVFAMFEDEAAAARCAERLRPICPQTYVTYPLERGAAVIKKGKGASK